MVSRLLAAVAAALVASAIGGCGSNGRPPPGAHGTVPVTEVTDGDTLHISYGGRDERLRLIGIDTPEVPWYGGDVECFGVEAGLYVRGRLSGRDVRIEFDRERRDRFGRLLAYVYVDRELVNLTLVRLGYARAYAVPPNTARSRAFAAAEAEARSSMLGLWSACPDER